MDNIVAICVEAEGHYNWLLVYGGFEPLLGETYLLYSGSHISSPWFVCILALEFLRSVLVGLWDHGYLSIFMLS